MDRLDGTDDAALTHLIRGGFLTIDEVKETLIRQHHDQDLPHARAGDEAVDDSASAAAEQMMAEVDRRFADKIIDDRATTDFLYDRLDDAFLRLNEQDAVVARHHVGGSQQEARDEVGAACLEGGGSAAGVLGGLFYTEHDLVQAIDDGVLRLGFFAVGPDIESCAAGLEKMMPQVLRRLGDAGLPVHWEGDHHRKIEIRPITWSKASPTDHEPRSIPRHAYRYPITAPDAEDLDEPASAESEPEVTEPVAPEPEVAESVAPEPEVAESVAPEPEVAESGEPVSREPVAEDRLAGLLETTVPEVNAPEGNATAGNVPGQDAPGENAPAGNGPAGNGPRENVPEADAPEHNGPGEDALEAPQVRPAPSPSPGPAPVRPSHAQPNPGLLGRLGKRLFKR